LPSWTPFFVKVFLCWKTQVSILTLTRAHLLPEMTRDPHTHPGPSHSPRTLTLTRNPHTYPGPSHSPRILTLTRDPLLPEILHWDSAPTYSAAVDLSSGNKVDQHNFLSVALISVHQIGIGTKFGLNTSISGWVINNYHEKWHQYVSVNSFCYKVEIGMWNAEASNLKPFVV